MTTLEKIHKAVEESKKYPSPTIEYNLELPESPNITENSFYGVPAVFNKNVSETKGCNVTFKY